MKSKKQLLIMITALSAFLLVMMVGCTDGTSTSAADVEAVPEQSVQPTLEEVEVLPTKEQAEATELPEPTDIPPTEIAEPTKLPENLLSPEPQVIEFESEDGFALNGMYYPAAVNPAPTIVLMHWAPGDQTDWIEIATWLQNRGLGGENSNSAIPWLDPSWFRYCESGCSNWDPDGWLMDAQAAMRTVRELEGIDATRIVAIGTSIGADGAADSCFWYNDLYDHGCLGALSISPGSYLTVPYVDAVATLESQTSPKPAWCFYGVSDTESSITCQSTTGELYQTFEWEESPHGMELIDPDMEPRTLELMLDFLNLSSLKMNILILVR
jgi:hypothetical protein